MKSSMKKTIKSNKRPLTLLVGLILAGQASLALATNQVGEFYVGGKAGLTQFSDECGANSLDCEEHSEGFGVYGGYQALDWLSVEVGYDSLGKSKASYPALLKPSDVANYDATVQGIELGLKADYALSERVDLFAKGGTLLWQVEKSGSEPGLGGVNEDEDGSSLMLGAGWSTA